MATVLDSNAFAPGDRTEAFHTAWNEALSPPTRLHSMASDTHGVFRHWVLGPEIELQELEISTQQFGLMRTSRSRLVESNPGGVSLSISPAGSVLTDNRGVRYRGRQLRLMDLTSDYAIAYNGNCRTVACNVDLARLGLPVESIRTAVAGVGASPLYDLMGQHLLELAKSVDRLSPSTLALAGSGTAELARAMIQSVSSREADRRGALAETMPVRIENYVRRHLDDPNLTPARIAAAHNISLRYLYILLSDRAETPAEWIMSQRLAAAKRELEQGSSNVSTTAQRWGFRDHPHFTRRFKAAYGMTPSEFVRRTRQPLP